ncbi:Ger(x)C family spore germination protein [Bacillus cereus]|uniref:Ger(X)C family germination protein n=1 Tax=Bacillus cereus VD184 TaxID=1053242 RepID=A0A9W5R5C8_BACCE|nr:Ger(x)C family spore germination protein [Bacillus cereus]EOQ08970.1 Ger(X)C family germination protein [Bacillus cereus VD184]
MRRVIHVGVCICIFAIFLSDIGKSLNIEDATFTLALGIDLDQEGRLKYYAISPVFGREIKDKKETLYTTADSTRESRGEFDKKSPGLTIGSKVQIILIGKNLLKHRNWFSLLDVFYRDFKGTVSPIVIAVDGPVSEIFHYTPDNKPLISIFLKKLITTAKLRGELVHTNLQELHRQIFEKGVTPYIPTLKKNNKLTLIGTSLLHNDGTFCINLNSQETVLLQILQGENADYSFTFPVPTGQNSNITFKNRLSFSTQDVKTTIQTKYINKKFYFDIHITMELMMTEKLLSQDMKNGHEKLEKIVKKQLKRNFETLIKKLQVENLDPIGLGIHARAYQHTEYSHIKQPWEKKLSESKVCISVNVNINTMGGIK